MCAIEWPRLPMHPDELWKIRELMTAEEYEALVKRNEALLKRIDVRRQ